MLIPTTMQMAMTVRRDGDLCATVDGLALWQGVDRATARELAALLGACGVLVLRRQCLTEAELVHAASLFGAVEASIRYDWASPHTREVGFISNLRDAAGRPIGGLGNNEVVWHCDQSYRPNPATGAMLYCVEAPPEAGRTYWASLSRAYAALPEATKRRIDDYRVSFSYEKRTASYEAQSRPGADIRELTPPVAHRLVNRHPHDGRASLYLDPATATGIVGLAQDEADRLLAELCEHATQPRFVYTHRWEVGDLVIWDNAVTLHRREPFDPTLPRLLKRLQFRLPAAEFICPE
jgi:putative 2-oxoglutarate oxygenase